jgi:hypothetical protein
MDGFSEKKVWEAIKLNPVPGGADPVEAMRIDLPEEFLDEFDGMVSRVANACDAAMRDIAEQKQCADNSMQYSRKDLSHFLKSETKWTDGTPISDAFLACKFAPFVPYDGDGATVPVTAGAWQQMNGKSRSILLKYVLKTLEDEKEAANGAQ